ncbi:hypothetical protein UFOVP1302_31 [uncultured Caudovirales phage]|uniref:Uncharacterized protein n=1 Tax=uncultured Caudovirales phage TaxID=2100421 RepID=A0A6J5PPP5_9CAUD|nr:hypothetical protein UFOVP895_34 [uncultured Caudovirales phage]CAB4181637.1 hypothetical protein UFOVP1070_53 [uncultured Caudovirales phage]CAB4195745.1 hypothetical protein UFOVP1302_31 [uncultured Caudovirales phage]CAB4211636.1 hypothetical protein UFOVP1416_1 [uncultured Caudovirales phage]
MKLPDVWEVIAESRYTGVHGSGLLRWVSVPDAPVTTSEARCLYENGTILMSQKRLPCGKMGLLIKLRKN